MDRKTAENVIKALFPGAITEEKISEIINADPLEIIEDLEAAEAEKAVIDAVWCYV